MKAAGFEPVEVRSGYTGNDMGAYMELRDERVVFFVRTLARGKHSVAYRMRAEIPGKFSALPTRACGDVRAGTEGQLGRDEAEDRGLKRQANKLHLFRRSPWTTAPPQRVVSRTLYSLLKGESWPWTSAGER